MPSPRLALTRTYVAPTTEPAPGGGELPDDWPEDIPVMEGATVDSSFSSSLGGDTVTTAAMTTDESVEAVPLMDFDAGYVRRVAHTLPRQGTVEPWALKQNYLYDARALRRANLDDGVLDWS